MKSTPPPEPQDEKGIAESNLMQALLDFEVANGRVMDLAHRLTAMSEELMRARTDLDAATARARRAELDLAAANAELDVMKGSLAYRAARFTGDARARLRR